MASMPDCPQQKWEYRRVFAVPRFRGSQPGPVPHGVGQLTDELLAVIDDLHQSGAEDWQVVRVKLEEDGQGRRWLSACLKRPRTAVEQNSDQKVLVAAARREPPSCTISDLLGTAPTVADVNRVA